MANPAKEFKQVIKAAEKQGWRAKRTKKGWMLYAPASKGIVTVHMTPSDQRALANTVARMRRYGFKWKGR